jgi:chromosome segregation ATPase
MEPTQTSQMLKWLDEERRKDKAQISALQERLEGLAQQLGRQGDQLAALEQSVASLRVMSGRFDEFSQTLENLRAELVNTLEGRDEQHRKEHREAERSRQLEIGAVRDEINRFTEEIRPIPRLGERISVVAAENSRLNENLQRLDTKLTDLSKRTEDRLQAVIYLEEQRRADHQRIVELEKVLSELRRRIETFEAKMPLLEEAIPKIRTRLEEGLKPIKEFEGVVEELRIADFRRNQDAKKWLGQAEEVKIEVERLREESQRFLTSHRDVNQALKGLEAFQERLDTRQNESMETQRLMEERIRRQWEEWQGKQEKDRRNWEVASEERWREQMRFNKRAESDLHEIPETLKVHWTQLNRLWEARRQDASRYFKNSQAEYEAAGEEADENLAELRDLYEMPEGV